MHWVIPEHCGQPHPILNGLHCLFGLNYQGPHKGLYYDFITWSDDDNFEVEEGYLP